jgi:uncharacterized protein (TIGR02757 family)
LISTVISGSVSRAPDRAALEGLYRKYNDRRYISPDPLEFVHRYESPEDREVVALIASSLAFGTVKQICGSVARVLEPLGSNPALWLLDASREDVEGALRSFRHRWIAGADMVSMLRGIRGALKEHGSLRELFYAKLDPGDSDVAPALSRFSRYVFSKGGGFRACLLPSPESGSACKRLNLFLRWMVRSDAVDPGGWSEVPPAMLIVPLDTHMYRISKRLGFTGRRTADLKTAREITEGFREISPDDPVRYDFALTRVGILRDGEEERNLARLRC